MIKGINTTGFMLTMNDQNNFDTYTDMELPESIILDEMQDWYGKEEDDFYSDDGYEEDPILDDYKYKQYQDNNNWYEEREYG